MALPAAADSPVVGGTISERWAASPGFRHYPSLFLPLAKGQESVLQLRGHLAQPSSE